MNGSLFVDIGSPYKRTLCAKTGWNLPKGSGAILRKDALCQVWLSWTMHLCQIRLNCHVIREKRILKFRESIFTISLLSPLGKWHVPSFEQIWTPFTQLQFFMPCLFEISPLILEKIFKFRLMNVVSLFCNYLPCKKIQPFIWSNLKPLYPRMLCAKFGGNWPCGSRGEEFWISSMYFSIFRSYFTLKLALWFWRSNTCETFTDFNL